MYNLLLWLVHLQLVKQILQQLLNQQLLNLKKKELDI